MYQIIYKFDESAITTYLAHMATLFRKLTNEKFSTIELDGAVLDLGSSRGADYHRLFKGDFKITTLNYTNDENADIVFDLEKSPLPIPDNKFDSILAINLLEHIFHSRELLKESFRILNPGGRLIITVPFLHQIHPSPHDYYRYTKECLVQLLCESNFSEIEVSEIGIGAFSGVANLIERFFPAFLGIFLEKFFILIDMFLVNSSKFFKKKYSGSEYPLGYFVIAKKQY